MNMLQSQPSPAFKQRVLAAAHLKFDEPDIIIKTDESIDEFAEGEWFVQATLIIRDDELEPEPGPTYLVLYSRFLSGEDGYSDWQEDSRLTFDDDPDGQCARLFAHRRARELRNELGSRDYVAVRDAAKQHSLRRPWNPSCPEHDFRDFSAAWLGL